MDGERHESVLRDAGLRVTQGRLAVLEALAQRPHADAETVFQALLPSLPGTSIQNVHNVLGDLTAAGLLRRIEPAGSPARYERRIGDNHHHVVCTSCGAVADVDCVVGHAPCLHPSEAAGYAIDTAEVTFWGLCPSCQEHAERAQQHDNEENNVGRLHHHPDRNAGRQRRTLADGRA